jgi:endonuclease/exonuclease/phosphatase family metal-dependent hydrolase
MPTPLRIATFNVENLFSRAKLLNFQNNEKGDALLAEVGKLQRELRKATYDKPEILELYHELKDYIEIVEMREKLFDRAKRTVVAKGARDWSGFVSFKRDKFSGAALTNTARVIREVNADIFCLIEAESRPTLKQFCTDLLPNRGSFKRYPSHMLIDGNDPRGIDVALASRIPLRSLRSHVDDTDGTGVIFSRDCLELELAHPAGFTLWVLLNHLKSKGYGAQATSNEKRRRQAQRVAEILQGYNLKTDLVVVAGDLNDTPESTPLAPLVNVPDLHDVLQLSFADPQDRWTYHYKKNQQIDYLLVSTPLRDALQRAGVERRGIHDVQKFTDGAIEPFDTVAYYTDSASDHGAVWADFHL